MDILDLGSSNELGAVVVRVDGSVLDVLQRWLPYGFHGYIRRNPIVSEDVVASGDALSLRVFESFEDYPLLGEDGSRIANIEQIQVNDDGEVFIPYIGKMKAAGKLVSVLRDEIEQELGSQTANPQVKLTWMKGERSGVPILGSVVAPGIYPLRPSSVTLLAVLSEAGGVNVEPASAKISVFRAGSLFRVWADDLFADPYVDFALQDGDVVTVVDAKRSFTALGAFSVQALVPFENRSLSVLDGIARVGGLDSAVADAGSVFVFRDESAELANAILRRGDLHGRQRVIYAFDLNSLYGLHIAREFQILDGDTLYVPEAGYVRFRRTLDAWTSTEKALFE